MSNITKYLTDAKEIINRYTTTLWREHNWKWRILAVLAIIFVINILLMSWWSREPQTFDVAETRSAYLAENQQPVVGSAVVGTTIKIIDTLINKSGGYLRNDIMPPSIFMDNIPEWEYGVLKQLQEVVLNMRNGFSRSQSQSAQSQLLENAENKLRIPADKWWIYPTPEKSYAQAIDLIKKYGVEIADEDTTNAQFYARADNLANYLEMVSTTMGDLTQRLSASVGDRLIDVDMRSSDVAQSSNAPVITEHRTPRFQIDNIFYETRGYAWALLHELQAIRIDFNEVLIKKNAAASLEQIINELEKTQKKIWSPFILNGRGFGFSANHSLVMASYISRANAAIIDMAQLLKNG